MRISVSGTLFVYIHILIAKHNNTTVAVVACPGAEVGETALVRPAAHRIKQNIYHKTFLLQTHVLFGERPALENQIDISTSQLFIRLLRLRFFKNLFSQPFYRKFKLMTLLIIIIIMVTCICMYHAVVSFLYQSLFVESLSKLNRLEGNNTGTGNALYPL